MCVAAQRMPSATTTTGNAIWLILPPMRAIATTVMERRPSVCLGAEVLDWTTTITAQLTMNATWTHTSARRPSVQRTRCAKDSTKCATMLMTIVSTAEAVKVLDVAPGATTLPSTVSQEMYATWTPTSVRIPISANLTKTATRMCQESVTQGMLSTQSASSATRVQMETHANQGASMTDLPTQCPAVQLHQTQSVTRPPTGVRPHQDINCSHTSR